MKFSKLAMMKQKNDSLPSLDKFFRLTFSTREYLYICNAKLKQQNYHYEIQSNSFKTKR